MTRPNHLFKRGNGFSLTELMVAIAIVGILGAISLPHLFNQIQKTKQNEVAATVSQITTTIASFTEEMGLLPESWSDLNKITPLMTPEGPANQTNFDAVRIVSQGCTKTQQTGCYTVTAEEGNQVFVLKAIPENPEASKYNVVACIDLRTGGSDLKKGTNQNAARASQLNCNTN